MITPNDLKKDDKQRKNEKLAKEKKLQKDNEQFLKEMLTKNSKRARDIIDTDGELENFIKRTNALGIKIALLDEFRCWTMDKRLDRHQLYDANFHLGFAPKADYAPTKILMKALKKAGFKVSTIEEQEHDLEFYGDGEYRNGPGTHPVYYLKISWD